MKWNEIINEIFSSNEPYKKISDTTQYKSSIKTYKFEIDQKIYQVIFRSDAHNNWDVKFGLVNNNHLEYGITNTKNQFKVFSTVIKILYKFILEINPQLIVFMADEKSRRKLYQAMANKLSPELIKHGFEISQDEYEFFIQRK